MSAIQTCKHAASGCNYPEGDCNGDCLIANVERLIRDKRQTHEGETMATQNDLPPLPYPQIPGNDYTAKDMQAYARQAIAHYRAKLLEGVGEPVAWLIPGGVTCWSQLASANGKEAVPLITADQAAAAVLREREKAFRDCYEKIKQIDDGVEPAYAHCRDEIRSMK